MDDRWNTTSIAETHGDSIRGRVRILTIILLALVMGQIIFASVVIFALNAWNQPSTGVLMGGIGALFAVQMFAMAVFIPTMAQKAGLKRADGSPESIIPIYQTKTIIAAALLEGSGFLNLVAFMLEHNKWSLIPVGLGILFILSMIPSEMKIANWADGILRTPPAE